MIGNSLLQDLDFIKDLQATHSQPLYNEHDFNALYVATADVRTTHNANDKVWLHDFSHAEPEVISSTTPTVSLPDVLANLKDKGIDLTNVDIFDQLLQSTVTEQPYIADEQLFDVAAISTASSHQACANDWEYLTHIEPHTFSHQVDLSYVLPVSAATNAYDVVHKVYETYHHDQNTPHHSHHSNESTHMQHAA